ncbi:MAG: glutamate racemase [Armatimonadetes bacterium]|nr:glutamate racemase [Armatimonadota bacterium]
MSNQNPIGIFDSGIGGLTVLKEVAQILPAEQIIYFADSARVPYGDKSKEEILDFVSQIIDFLLSKNVKAIVMACNTSSALAMPLFKEKLKIPILGMIHPAAREVLKITKNKRIGVMANPVTVKSKAYIQEISKYNHGALIYQASCPELVPLIEQNKLESLKLKEVLNEYLKPLLKENIDTLILACTHYPLIKEKVKEVVGEKIYLLDPAYFAAKELKEILKAKKQLNLQKKSPDKFFTTGNIEAFKLLAEYFLNDKLKFVKKVYF